MSMMWISLGLTVKGMKDTKEGAKKQEKALKAVANTPGLDIDSITKGNLARLLENLPDAEAASSGAAAANQRTLQSLLEDAIPGYKEIQAQRATNIESLLSGNLPPAALKALDRTAAGQALKSGISGSPAEWQLGSQYSADNALKLLGLGNDWAQGMISGTPRANAPGVEDLWGLNVTQEASIRSGERTQKMNLLGQAAGMPNDQTITGNFLQQIGGMGMRGGFGLGGIGGVSPAMQIENFGGQVPSNFGDLNSGYQQNYANLFKNNALVYGSGDQFQ